MIGGEAIAGLAIGDDSEAETTYEPVSKIVIGGAVNTRPAELVFLGAYLLWDNDDYIVYDNGDIISFG